MSIQHSPGPWQETIDRETGEVWVTSADATHSYYIGRMEGTCLECFANSRLIAAAPELLEEVKKLRQLVQEACGNTPPGTPERQGMKDAIERAAELIAKVEVLK